MRPVRPQLWLKDFQYFVLKKRQGAGFGVQTSNQTVQLCRGPGKIQTLHLFGKRRGKGNSLGGLGPPDYLPGLHGMQRLDQQAGARSGQTRPKVPAVSLS